MTQTLREQLIEFHTALEQPVFHIPRVPSEARVRLRAALITEEYFETMEAMMDSSLLAQMKESVLLWCKTSLVRVNMPELADGMADLDYVVEGTRLEFGINGGPIAAEVHRANMTKVGGDISLTGKRLKPPGFKPPDIEGELEKQGWK